MLYEVITVFLRDPSLTSLAERLSGADRPAAVDRSLRAYGIGAQILLDLGVRDMIVMSSTRPEPTALEGYGLRIVGWRRITSYNVCYTKLLREETMEHQIRRQRRPR